MSVVVVSPAPELSTSRGYWERIGFAVVREDKRLVVVTDGQVTLCLDATKTARPALSFFRQEPWDDVVERIAALTTVIPTEHGHLTSDPSGTWIHLRKGDGPTVPEGIPRSALGAFSGISLETVAVERTRGLYEALGFAQTEGSIQQGWVTMANPEGFRISLMVPFACPHTFVNPSLTYFNGERNLAIIAELRRRGVPLAEEVTVFNEHGEVDNVILRDPGGLGAFVFNDG